MLHVVVPAFVLGLSLLFRYLARLVRKCKRRKDISGVRKVLFVIAHPDDECMFFGPTVIRLSDGGCEPHLLCLSSGDYRRNGGARKEELRNSCRILGIESGRVTVVERTEMPDDPKIKWRDDLVARTILKHVIQLDVDTVISFDGGGGSGHDNHVSVYCGLSYLCEKGLLPSTCRAFVLESVNVVRKYVGILDVPWSVFNAKYAYVSSRKDISTVRSAMRAHSSQMLWFRWFYVYCSRYMIVNTYTQLPIGDDDGESYSQ